MLFVFCFPYLSLKYGLSITQCLSQKCHTDHEKKFRFVQLMDLIGLRSDKNPGIVRRFERGLISSAILGERQRTVSKMIPDDPFLE